MDYVLQVAINSNGRCSGMCYSEKVPESFNDMISEMEKEKIK